MLYTCFNIEVLRSSLPRKETLTGHQVYLSDNMSNTRENVSSGYSNTEERVDSMTCSNLFSTIFKTFGLPINSVSSVQYILIETKTKEQTEN